MLLQTLNGNITCFLENMRLLKDAVGRRGGLKRLGMGGLLHQMIHWSVTTCLARLWLLIMEILQVRHVWIYHGPYSASLRSGRRRKYNTI
jgi:hypothetical protein